MEKLIKNIDKSVVLPLKEQVAYEEGKVITRTLANKDGVGITLFAFAEGEGISTHAAGGDAMANVLEGTAEITVGGVPHIVHGGESIVMPVGVPHSLKALTSFKMLLVVVFPEEE